MTEALICVSALQTDTCSCRLANSALSSAETTLFRAFTSDNGELDSSHSMMWDHYDLAREFLGSCQTDSKTFFYSIQKENVLGFSTHTTLVEVFSICALNLLNFKSKVKVLECTWFKDPPEQKASNTLEA